MSNSSASPIKSIHRREQEDGNNDHDTIDHRPQVIDDHCIDNDENLPTLQQDDHSPPIHYRDDDDDDDVSDDVLDGGDSTKETTGDVV